MASDAKFIDPLDQDDTFLYFDDFFNYTSTEMFTSLAADGGSSVADSDAHGGELVLTCGGTPTTNAPWRPRRRSTCRWRNKPGKCKIRLKHTDADALAANVALGFSNIFTANFITDVATAPEMAADFSGRCSTSKRPRCEVAGGLARTVRPRRRPRRTSRRRRRVSHVRSRDPAGDRGGRQADVIFRYDGQQVRDANGDTIKHYLTLASLLAMKVGVYVKQGGATAQVAYVDYICWACKR
jgi:hypothetical protein